MSASQNIGLQPCQIAWAEAAAAKAPGFARLAQKGIIPGHCTREGLEQSILELQRKRSDRSVPELITKIQPIVTHLDTFCSAIAVMAQFDSKIMATVRLNPYLDEMEHPCQSLLVCLTYIKKGSGVE